MRHHILLAERFVSGMSYPAFRDDARTVYAVTRCLEIVSEASRRLPNAFKDCHPNIEWREMAAAGNIYRHEYEDVAAARVWHTLTASLPPLREVIDRALTDIGRQKA